MTIIVKVELRVCLTHEYVEIMQFSHWKLGVRLIHERVFHTRRYGTVPCFWDALAQIRCDDTNSRAIQDTVVSVQFLSPGWKWGTTFQWVSLSFFFFFSRKELFFSEAHPHARARACVCERRTCPKFSTRKGQDVSQLWVGTIPPPHQRRQCW